MNMVDFVAIMPYYAELVLKQVWPDIPIPQYLRVIRVVRLARILRIIRMTKAGKMAAVIVTIAFEAVSALTIPLYFLFLCTIMYSSAMFYSEKGEFVTCDGMTDQWAEGVEDDAMLQTVGLRAEHTLKSAGFCTLYDSCSTCAKVSDRCPASEYASTARTVTTCVKLSDEHALTSTSLPQPNSRTRPRCNSSPPSLGRTKLITTATQCVAMPHEMPCTTAAGARRRCREPERVTAVFRSSFCHD